MTVFYTTTEISNLVGLPEKYVDNYIKVGEELTKVRVGRSKKVAAESFQQWTELRNFGLVQLNRDDYIRCLEFAIQSFYAYASTSNFLTSTQRDAGKFISDFVSGKLGEIAVGRFLKRNFDIEIELDFTIRDTVMGQDITQIAPFRKGRRVYNPPKKRLAVKTSKMKNVWLIVPEKEATDAARRSDIYIFSRVDLVADHLIRLVRDHEALENIRNTVPELNEIPAEVCGFATHASLISESPTTLLPVQKQTIGSSYIRKTGKLERNRAAWELMLSTL